MSYNNIMSTLGASNGTTAPSASYRDNRTEGDRFQDWLRSIGVDPQSLDPQVKLVYYQMWREMVGKPPLGARMQG